MEKDASLRRVNVVANGNGNGNGNGKSSDDADSFPLVLALAASVCLAGVLSYYWKHDEKGHRIGGSGDETNHDGGGNDNSSSSNNSRNNNPAAGIDVDNAGEWGRRTTRKKENKDRPSDDGGDDASLVDLPEHLQRELHKEERRKASIRFLSMKKPLYENIEMYGPDGATMLCTIGKKKANWYVRKNLAVWREIPDCHSSIRLLFEPKNSSSKRKKRQTRNGAVSDEHKNNNNGGGDDDDDTDEKLRKYNCTHKRNICVSCGAGDASETVFSASDVNERCTEVGESGRTKEDDNKNDDENENAPLGLMRHYVVPYAYRRLLPTRFKTHLPHDVVLLCLDCHVDAEQAAKTQKIDVYERLYRTDPSTKAAVVVDYERKRIKSWARALWKHGDKLPPDRVEEYGDGVRAYLRANNHRHPNEDGTTNTNEIENTVLLLDKATESGSRGAIPGAVLRDLALNLATERKNPSYVPLASLVVENLCRTDREVQEFVVGWRRFFVDTLCPRHLPVGWSVDSPVRVDDDENQ